MTRLTQVTDLETARQVIRLLEAENERLHQRLQVETISRKRGVAIAASEIAGAKKGEARSPSGAGCGLLGRSSWRGLVAGAGKSSGWIQAGGGPSASGVACVHARE